MSQGFSLLLLQITNFRCILLYKAYPLCYINIDFQALTIKIHHKKKENVMNNHNLLGLAAGENKIHFIPGMIGPFLGVTLVPQNEVRNIMIPIFHDMMDWEQRKNGNFKQVHYTCFCFSVFSWLFFSVSLNPMLKYVPGK